MCVSLVNANVLFLGGYAPSLTHMHLLKLHCRSASRWSWRQLFGFTHPPIVLWSHLNTTCWELTWVLQTSTVYIFFRWSTFKCSCARRYRFFTATRGLTRIDLVFPCPAISSQNHSMRSPLIKPLVCATKSWWSTPKPKLSTVVANILCK